LRVNLPDALDAVLEPREVLCAPVDGLLILVDVTPSSRRRIVTGHRVREARGWIVGSRRVEERPLIPANHKPTRQKNPSFST